jgi:subtilisin family serine protease
MDVAKLLTCLLSITLLGFTTAAQADNETHHFIIRLKDTARADGTVKSFRSQNIRERGDRLAGFKRERLQHRRGLVLPRTGFLIAEDLSPAEIQELRSHPDVDFVEENIVWRSYYAGHPSSQPSSFEQAPWFRDLMGFQNDSPDPFVEPNFSQTRSIVAVIDSGTRIDHPYLVSALEPNFAEINGLSGVDDDQNGFIDDTYGANAITRRGSGTELYSSHGTHVAGIVKAVRDHAIQEFSQAKQVSILPVRFIGDDGTGSTAAAITALEYAAARGAKVINASWGAKGRETYSQALYETFARLYEMDIFFSVAAGNADQNGPSNNDQIPNFPANFNIPSLLSVASATPFYNVNFSGGPFRLISLTLSNFSNFGNSVHIAAPGDYADGRGGGYGILSANSGFGPWGNLYIKKQGTSMAAPVVAGIAGVMRAVNPNLTAYEIKDLIMRSAKKHQSLSSIQSSSLVHARDAIVLAKNTSSQGLKPRLPSSPITSSQPNNPPERSGGCASVAPVNPEGPFGGNSLGLISLVYALFLLRKSKRRQRA